MFKRKKSNYMKKQEEVNSNSFSTINVNTTIIGQIQSDVDLRIDGKIEGNINTKSKVVLGASAQVKGDIVCKNADISCNIIGNVYVEDKLKLNSTANLRGNIFTKKLIVESGAIFIGKSEMGHNKNVKELLQNNEATSKVNSEKISKKISEK